MDVWKKILCHEYKCLYEALDAEGRIKEDFYIYPDVDNKVMTQFTCPRCGMSETWGITRREVQRIIYEKLREDNLCPENL